MFEECAKRKLSAVLRADVKGYSHLMDVPNNPVMT